MMNENEYYNEIKNWDFDEFQIETELLTNWDLIKILKSIVKENSKILDLGTGGGEKLLKYYPNCSEILGTDLSYEMILTANNNLKKSGRKNISFRVMDNLNMDVLNNYYDIVIARHTVIDPRQIYKVLKEDGYLLVRGVDKYDCHSLKRIFKRGQAYNDKVPISIIDYEAILDAGFKDVELVPIFEREFFKNKDLFLKFLRKVPILDDFSEQEDSSNYCKKAIDEVLLDKYISENTYDNKIKLLRRYYGIIAKK